MGAPSWKKIYDRWLSFGVPPVEVLTFVDGMMDPRLCWVSRSDQSRFPYQISNPQRDVAWRFVQGFTDFQAENYAAFLLHAYADQHEDWIGYDIGTVIYNRARDLDETDCWHKAARRLIPGESRRYTGEKNSLAVVDAAAEAWINVSQSFSVVRIPEFMDFESDEYVNYITRVRKMNISLTEEQDRQEYERLRKKYEE
jgi:hypothetical protein